MAIENNELLGKVLGTCTLQHLLGRGGMGVVYLARQSRPRRTIAVKVLVPSMHTDPKARAEFLVRFRREADAIAALDHINIMPIYEYGEQGEMAYLVMPFVTGGTLRTLLEQKGILSLSEVVPIIEQAASALDSAHAQGIVHRDLKPGNILFHADGRILLADFGLAKVVRGNEDSSSSDSLATLTSVGTIIGTPEYLSPEQSTGQPIGPYSDIYSLGIVLYQMLGGHVPFTGASPVAIALKHTMETPPSLLQLNPALPLPVEAVVMKALAKLPEERFTSAGEFARALRTAAFGTPPASNWLSSTPDNSVPDQYTTQDITATPTEERPLVSPSKDFSSDSVPEQAKDNLDDTWSDSISKLPTESQLGVAQREEVGLPEYSSHAEKSDLLAPATGAASLPVAFGDAAPSIRQASPLIVPPPAKKFTDGPSPTPRRGCQSASMMLLGSFLTLLLVVGGFIVYLNLTQKSTSRPPHVTDSARATAKVTKVQAFTPPASLVTTAGNVLYGTASPGPSCDSQGGQWSKQAGITITCMAQGGWTQLTNNGSNVAGIFLNTLPHGQNIPDNYVLQVQIDTASMAQGQFGVFIRNQPGTPTGADSFLIDSSGTWTRNEYNNQTGTAAVLGTYPVVGEIHGSNTLDVSVQGDTYSLYINGVKQGGTQSARYSNGNLGLMVDAGTTLSFKNMVIYAL